MKHAIKTTLHKSCDRIVFECGDYYGSVEIDTTKWTNVLADQEAIHRAAAMRAVVCENFSGELISAPLTPPRFERMSIKNTWVHIIVEK